MIIKNKSMEPLVLILPNKWNQEFGKFFIKINDMFC